MASVWAAAQKAVYEALVADTGVHAFVADRIYDGVPQTAAMPYVAFGPSDVIWDDEQCDAQHQRETLQIEVWSSDQARLRIAKEICDAVRAALHRKPLVLDEGAAVQALVLSMQVRPDPDGVMAQGIISLQIDTDVPGA